MQKINVNTNYSTNFKQYPPKAITNTIEQSAKAVQNHLKETAAVGAGLALTSLGVISAKDNNTQKPRTDKEAKKMIEDMLLPDKKIYNYIILIREILKYTKPTFKIILIN